MPAALLALAISAFGIGCTEFIMMGLLPEVAVAFHVSIPTAGDLISGYALGVVVGAPLLTAASTRLSRRTVLLGLMAVFTAGNLFAAVAQSYPMLLAARVLTGLPHGALFGVGSVVAAGMVPSDRRARAISMMFAGLVSERDWGAGGHAGQPARRLARRIRADRGNRRREHHRDRDAGTATTAIHRQRPQQLSARVTRQQVLPASCQSPRSIRQAKGKVRL